MKTDISKIEDLEKVFKDYYNPLVNFVYKYLRNYEDSRDVVQMTFTKLWANREDLVIHSSLKSYLYSTAKNTMIDYVRKISHHDKVTDLDESFLIEDINEDDFDAYRVRGIIDKSILKLKPRTKEIFILHKFEGLTYSEIAHYMGISKRAVEDNMAKSIEFLKEDLKNHPELF